MPSGQVTVYFVIHPLWHWHNCLIIELSFYACWVKINLGEYQMCWPQTTTRGQIKCDDNNLSLFFCLARFFYASSTKIWRIRSDEGLTLETSAVESLYGGQFTLSTQLMKPNYLVILPTDAVPLRFCRNLPLYSNVVSNICVVRD